VLKFFFHALEGFGVLLSDVLLFYDVLAQVKEREARSGAIGEFFGDVDVAFTFGIMALDCSTPGARPRTILSRVSLRSKPTASPCFFCTITS
jgi:hypothetical protein